MSMDQAAKAKWVAKLRSGDYVQGVGKLRSPENQYCCLGVLCEVAVEDGILPLASHILGDADLDYAYDGHSAFLPPAVSDAYKMDSTSRLIEMNDDEKASFTEIADYIEKNC